MENIVRYDEYVNNECPYKGCEYNWNGVCENQNPSFLWARIEELYYKYILFLCDEQEVKPGYCEFCGAELEKVVQIYDKKYGNKYEWICPECG